MIIIQCQFCSILSDYIYYNLLKTCIRGFETVEVRSDHARFVIRDSSIFYSYKICKQCKWTYS